MVLLLVARGSNGLFFVWSKNQQQQQQKCRWQMDGWMDRSRQVTRSSQRRRADEQYLLPDRGENRRVAVLVGEEERSKKATRKVC